MPSFNNHNIQKLKRAAYFICVAKESDINIKIDHGLEAAMQKAIANTIDAKYAVVLEVVKMLVKPRQPNSEDFKRVTLLVHEKYTEVKFDGVSIGKIRAMYKKAKSPIDIPIQSGYEFTPNDEFKK